MLEGWVDSDFASCPDTRRSTSGYVLSLNGAPVSWKAKRQASVALSSAEAEFVAASLCGKEVVYIRAVMRGMGQEQLKPTILWEDNQACIDMAANPVHRERSRHIDVKVHNVRELQDEGVLKLKKVDGEDNVADALTKNLPSSVLLKHAIYLFGSRVPFASMYSYYSRLSPCPNWWSRTGMDVD